MEQMDHILNPLLPMLKSCITEKKIVALAKQLMVKGHFSRNSIKEFISISSKAESEKTFTSFINYFKEDAQNDWEEALLKVVSQGGLHTLHDVLKCYFVDKSETISLFLRSWDTLQDKRDEMLLIAQKLNFKIEIDEKEKSWLLSYIYQILQNGDDALEQVIAALSEDKTTRDDQVSLPATTDLYDVDKSLTPLVLLLTRCLSESNLTGIVANLHVGEEMHLTLDSMSMLNDSAESNSKFQETILLFIDCLKKDVKAPWKTDFLNSLDEQELDLLHYFIRRFFKNPTKFLVWVLQQWEQLEIRKDKLVEIAHVRKIGLDLTSKSELCVLQIITSTLQRDDGDDVLQWLITKFLQEKNILLEQSKLDERSQVTFDGSERAVAVPCMADSGNPTLIVSETHEATGGDSAANLPEEPITSHKIATEKETEMNESGDASTASSKSEEDEESFVDASNVPAFGSDVKKLSQEFELFGGDILPPEDKNGANNQKTVKGTTESKGHPEKKKEKMERCYVEKTSKPLPKPNVPTKHKRVIDEEVTFAGLKKLLYYGDCVVEFRARLAEPDFVMAEGSTLLLYLDNESGKKTYPMQFYPRFTLTYKYCIENGDWEHLMYFRDFQHDVNRQWTVNSEQKDRRYAIKFDVVVTKPCSVEESIAFLGKNICKFLNCEIDLDQNADNENIIMHMHNEYRNWWIGLNNDPYTTQKVCTNIFQPTAPFKMSCKKERKVSSISYFLGSLFDNKDSTVRVLCMLAFVTAMESDVDRGEYVELHYNICKALSMENVKEENYETLITHLKWFFQLFPVWRSVEKSTFLGSSLLEMLEKFFKTVSNIPESLLVLPLIKLLHTITDPNSNPTIPSIVSNESYRSKEWNSKLNQKVIVTMGERVLNLAQRYPWILGIYAEMLTVETTAEILSKGSHLSALIDVDVAFNKLLDFWNKIASKRRGTPDFNEDAVSGIVAYITTKIHEAITSGRSPSDEKRAINWMDQCEALWKSVSEIVACQSKESHIGCIASTLTLIDHVIEFAQICEEGLTSKLITTKQNRFLERLMRTTSHFFQTVEPKLSITEIKLWNTLSDFNWTNENVIQNWIYHCENSIVDSVKKMPSFKFRIVYYTPEKSCKSTIICSCNEIFADLQSNIGSKFDSAEDLINFYANEFYEMKPNELLAKCITEVLTFMIGDGVLMNRRAKWLAGYFFKPNAIKVIWKIVKNKWQIIDGNLKHLKKKEILLNFFEKWPPAAFFVRKLYKGFEAAEQPLSQKKKKFLNTISYSLLGLMSALNEGKISISCIIMISNIESFWQCYDAAFQFCKSDDDSGEFGRSFSEKQYAQLLYLRKQEVAEFHSVKNNLEEFMKLAMFLKKDGLNLNCKQLQQEFGKKLSAGNQLCDLVKCKQFPSKSEVHNVVLCSVVADELKDIIKMVECWESTYARRVTRDTAAPCDENELTISRFLKEVWKPAYNKIWCTCKKLNDGSISFQTVEQLFEQNLNATLDQVKTEVNILFEILERSGINSKNSDERSNQVHKYLVLKRRQSIAAVLIAIKEKLNLKGMFETFQHPLNVSESLNNITEDTIKAVSILENVTEQQLQVLQIFCEGELLLWLKKHMKDRSEVKVMSDLAMTSAGETPMEVDRVSCFLSAVMGFSPLIFDLSEHAGLNELLSACRQVWENVERDEHLIRKWIDLSKQMEWLKNLKELQWIGGEIRAQEITKEEFM